MLTETQDSDLTDLCTTGSVIVVTLNYPPGLGAIGVVMQNLLNCFNSKSYVVATTKGPDRISLESTSKVKKCYINSSINFSSRLNVLWQCFQQPQTVLRLGMLAKRTKPSVIICVYPDYFLLAAARQVAKSLKIPWIVYLHDTLEDLIHNSNLGSKAARLQQQFFAEASRVLVLNKGMAEFYRHRYGQVCEVVDHSYPESIPQLLNDSLPARQAFWSGSIYSLHTASVARVIQATRETAWPFVLTSQRRVLKELQKYGIGEDDLKFIYYDNRHDYLMALQQQGILILALNWPDESTNNPDELATVFPTKTPEYLATGRPILVHCPEDYYLARFFKQNGCGLVVSERSIPVLTNAVASLLENSDAVRDMRAAALRTARRFTADQVSLTFHQQVELVSRSRWGEPIAVGLP